MSGDDEIIVRGGDLKEWLNYKVWGLRGWYILVVLMVAIAVLGIQIGKHWH